MIELILGGARSGKSRFAEQQAIASGKKIFYIATAQVLDNEMAERIKIHQQGRSDNWKTIEEPYALAKILEANAHSDHCLLVECLTLWLSNLIQDEEADRWQTEKDNLLKTLPTMPGHIIMVSNEVGSGIVPMGELSRQFVDEIGRLHQEVAKVSNKVVHITAGLAQTLKDTTLKQQ